MVKGNNRAVIVFILLVLIAFLIWIKMYITQTHDMLYKRLESNALQNMKGISKNIERSISEKLDHRDTYTLYEILKNSRSLREEIEKDLTLFISTNVQYVYLVYKDKQNRFRFLADGSSKDKARFNQKIDFDNENYIDIYTRKKDVAITQNTLEKLSITYLYPLVRHGEVDALLVFDFSSNLKSDLEKILEPVQTLFMFIYTLIGIFIFITLIQTFYYYQARKRSFVDKLTQTYNRHYLRHYLKTIDISQYQILMVDFDYFKKVNDHYGHETGDIVLSKGAEVMKALIRDEDKIFRYGGEEFLLLIKSTDVFTVEEVAERIRLAIHSYDFSVYNMPIQLSVSMGLNTTPAKARNISEAIKIADMMLFKAKDQGRNRLVSNKEFEQVNVEDTYSIRDTIHNIKEAIENDNIVCHYQKIVNAESQTYKYEALVRCIDDDGLLTYPNHFLSDIMHTSVYVDLSKRVIDLSTDMIGKRGIAVSINLSIVDLLNEELTDYLIEKLGSLDDRSSLLSIEILEHEEIHNIDGLKAIIDRLHQYGVMFSIDDFGSGYANFQYLIELKIDCLKIDGSLIEKVCVSEQSRHIVKAIINLAREMNMLTIAEFVSSQEIYDEVVSLGIDYMQGYYISSPETLS
jgi:diguanylate cyclase (GGDEF)-like protein